MIFTDDDKAAMSEELGLVGATLDRAIAQALIFAEGQHGAQRALEINRYTDTLEIFDGRVYLTYRPIVEEPAIEVSIRSRSQGSFGRQRPTALRNWSELAEGDYEIDYESGELIISPCGEQARIEYSSGFAFQEPLSAEELKIKEAIASILSIAVKDSSYTQGIKEFSMTNFYSVKFAESSSSLSSSQGRTIKATAAQDFLAELAKYRPYVLPI